MNIHQVSVSYVMEQDRLLIRINGKEGGEMRAWMTRRLALGLLPVLGQTTTEQISKVAAAAITTAAPPAAGADAQRGQMLAAFETEAELRGGDFETPYRTPEGAPADPALDAEPLLLTEIKVTLLGNGQLQLQLFEKLPGQAMVRNFQVVMEPQLSNALLRLLHQSVTASQWLQLPTLAEQASLVATAEPLELSADLAKPKYLN